VRSTNIHSSRERSHQKGPKRAAAKPARRRENDQLGRFSGHDEQLPRKKDPKHKSPDGAQKRVRGGEGRGGMQTASIDGDPKNLYKGSTRRAWGKVSILRAASRGCPGRNREREKARSEPKPRNTRIPFVFEPSGQTAGRGGGIGPNEKSVIPFSNTGPAQRLNKIRNRFRDENRIGRDRGENQPSGVKVEGGTFQEPWKNSTQVVRTMEEGRGIEFARKPMSTRTFTQVIRTVPWDKAPPAIGCEGNKGKEKKS